MLESNNQANKDNSLLQTLVAMTLVLSIATGGCSATSTRVANDPPSFNKGLDALEAKDFKQASFYFAELAKEGDPAAMNNLAVALLMVDRKMEAIYWFNKATRYGDRNAPKALADMGEVVPPANLIGKHPSVLIEEQNAQIFANIITGALVGVALGISLHYSYNSQGVYVPNYNPWKFSSKPTTETSGNKSSQSVYQPKSCSSNFNCGSGKRCVKAPYKSTGVCMKTVNEYGIQTYGPSSDSNIGINFDKECSFNTDCPIGFRCHSTYKACVKK